jgi:hypothetical protein
MSTKSTARYAKQFALAEKAARNEFGFGFNLLGERIQRALVAEHLLTIIGGQDESTDVNDMVRDASIYVMVDREA